MCSLPVPLFCPGHPSSSFLLSHITTALVIRMLFLLDIPEPLSFTLFLQKANQTTGAESWEFVTSWSFFSAPGKKKIRKSVMRSTKEVSLGLDFNHHRLTIPVYCKILLRAAKTQVTPAGEGNKYSSRHFRRSKLSSSYQCPQGHCNSRPHLLPKRGSYPSS